MVVTSLLLFQTQRVSWQLTLILIHRMNSWGLRFSSRHPRVIKSSSVLTEINRLTDNCQIIEVFKYKHFHFNLDIFVWQNYGECVSNKTTHCFGNGLKTSNGVMWCQITKAVYRYRDSTASESLWICCTEGLSSLGLISQEANWLAPGAEQHVQLSLFITAVRGNGQQDGPGNRGMVHA